MPVNGNAKNQSSAFESQDLSNIKILQPSPHTPGDALFAKRMALLQPGNDKATKEFSPLLRTVRKNRAKQLQPQHLSQERNERSTTRLAPKSNPGVLSYEEAEFSDSMESMAESSRGGLRFSGRTNVNASKVPGKIAGDNQQSIPLKKQEDQLEQYKNDNFGLKMKLFFVLQKLEESKPESVRSLTTENIELRTSVSQLKALNDKLKARCESMEEDNISKNDAKSTTNDESVLDKLKDYEGEIEDLKLASQDLEDKLKDKEDELDALQAHVKRLETHESDNSEDGEIIQQLTEEIDDLKDDIRRTREGRDGLVVRLENEVEELKDDIRRAKEEHEDSVERLENEIEELKEKAKVREGHGSNDRLIQGLKDEIEELKSSLRLADENQASNNHLIDEQQDQLEDLKQKLQQAKDIPQGDTDLRVQNFKDDIEDLQSDLQKVTEENENLRMQLKERSAFINELKQSNTRELEAHQLEWMDLNETQRREHAQELALLKNQHADMLKVRETELSVKLRNAIQDSQQENMGFQRVSNHNHICGFDTLLINLGH